MRIKVKQRDITDCGAACLASVASYYKLDMPVSKIRQIAGTDSKGTNVLGVVTAAEQLGFIAKGVKGGIDSLSKIPLPANSPYQNQKSPNGFFALCGRL